MHAPSLANPEVIQNLPLRRSPYWNILEYCRHIGIETAPPGHSFWLARIRKKTGGYQQSRLCPVRNSDGTEVSYSVAVELAQAWFDSPAIQEAASLSYPVGVTRTLKYQSKADCYTVGDAMRDYVEWKRIAATRAHFETNLSLINYHIIPRLGDLPAAEFRNRVLTDFCRDVLQTPPKRGNQPVGPRTSIESLDPEALRKRKKTLNTLIGILRLALRMAWENSEVESERAWRCIRRLPNTDAPRHIFLGRGQCRSLLSHCRLDLSHLVRGALYTGCRVSELARMEVGDVGAGVFGVHIRPSKNGRSRYVVMSSEGMSFFLSLSRGRANGDLLFRMESGKTWAGNHKHLFKAAVRAAGLPDEFVFHGLRHTYASQLVQAGTPLAVVAAQLGHANTDTISRTYGHLCCESIEIHVERGFSALDENPSINRAGLSELRKHLSLGDKPACPPRSWPRSNFALASFVGSQQ